MRGRPAREEHMRSRYLDLEDRTQDLAELFRDEPALAQQFLRKYDLSWIYHENALEGLVFSGQEIETALAHQPVAEASSLTAFRDVRNFKAGIDIVRSEAAGKKPRISLALVKKLYETLHAGIESFTHQKHWGCLGSLVIDARAKPHHAPPLVEDPEVTRRVNALAVAGEPLHGII